jgi:hypothetical protein
MIEESDGNVFVKHSSFRRDRYFPESFVMDGDDRYELLLHKRVFHHHDLSLYEYILNIVDWPYESAIFHEDLEDWRLSNRLVYISLSVVPSQKIIRINNFQQYTTSQEGATAKEREIGKGMGKIVMCYVVNSIVSEWGNLEKISLSSKSLIKPHYEEDVTVEMAETAKVFLSSICKTQVASDDVMDPDVRRTLYKKYLEGKDLVSLEMYYFKNFGLKSTSSKPPCRQRTLENTIANFLQHCEKPEVEEVNLFKLMKIRNTAAAEIRDLMPWIARLEASQPSLGSYRRFGISRSISGKLMMRSLKKKCRK